MNTTTPKELLEPERTTYDKKTARVTSTAINNVSAEATDDVQLEDNFDGNASMESEPSTVVYEHEAWDTFKFKANLLAYDIFLHFPFHLIDVERMSGGGNNRIASIHLRTRLSDSWKERWFHALHSFFFKPADQYILRIPRFGHGLMDFDVAAQKFANVQLGELVPKVIKFDMSENNVLGMGYMVQNRLPGEPLALLWNGLAPVQRKDIARQIIKLMRKLQDITHSSCCVVSNTNAHKDPPPTSASSFDFTTLEVPAKDTALDNFGLPKSEPAFAQTTLDFILTQCRRYQHYETHKTGWTWEFWAQFAEMASTMHVQGLLPHSAQYHFTHLDLHPRNILVTVEGSTKISMTGVLDWDSALFTPAYMAFRAPYWMWADENACDDDETQALREPPENEIEECDLKRMFEEMAGQEWLKYAYGEEYVLLRRMFPFIRDGVDASHIIGQCQQIVKDWEDMHK
jgi:aminoglycoside phosphotransferase (APT) family kinase protein